jgi:hypothetical protein
MKILRISSPSFKGRRGKKDGSIGQLPENQTIGQLPGE